MDIIKLTHSRYAGDESMSLIQGVVTHTVGSQVGDTKDVLCLLLCRM